MWRGVGTYREKEMIATNARSRQQRRSTIREALKIIGNSPSFILLVPDNRGDVALFSLGYPDEKRVAGDLARVAWLLMKKHQQPAQEGLPAAVEVDLPDQMGEAGGTPTILPPASFGSLAGGAEDE